MSQSSFSVIIGECLIDTFVESGNKIERAGGGPFNTCLAMGKLGSEVRFVSTISQDKHGITISRLLNEAGVNTAFSIVSVRPTGFALAKLDDAGNASYSFQFEGSSLYSNISEEVVSKSLIGANCIGIGSLGILLENFREISKFAVKNADADTSIFLDPNIRPIMIEEKRGRKAYLEDLEWFCSNSRVVKCSIEDLEWWFPDTPISKSVENVIDLGPELIILTNGSEGSSAYCKMGEIHAPTEVITNSNVIGAGDSFFGALISFYSIKGESLFNDLETLSDCLSFANQTAHSWIKASQSDNQSNTDH